MEVDKKNNLVWLDMEMTGLDPEKDVVLEIAVVVTDSKLNYATEGIDLVIHQPDSVLESMGEWCKKQHAKSGLVEKVKTSTLTVEEAEKRILDNIKEYVEPNTSPLCGNSVSYDRLFLNKYMPNLHAFFHYRHIDVSTVKELCKRWYPDGEKFKKEGKHLALEDIRESIEELKFYKAKYFKE
ncbi:oligoribonuclease [Candidatus Margulisiibacteriota bacterium]